MTLYEFYGDGCTHCENMMPKVEKLQEQGFEIERLEVWNDKENAKKLKELDDGKCGGVPFFINTDSGEWICGEADMDTMKSWAKGEELE